MRLSINVGSKIRELRKSLKISQAELGERIGVKQRTISAWESNQNEPPLDALLQM
ncbi:helix-turn-helix domain-containing protein [Nitrosophilus labii]|uniref:helix-turn-helix domain-containing protein n=1 Tax=Nitrosophilus labii TaxID=2706014 RepID=UPI00165744EB|nr:helix-turn-helix transcriptional regulator [Nitrosophilus labii]